MTDIRQLLATAYYEAIKAGNLPTGLNPFATILDLTSGYVPYTGATGDIDVNTNKITSLANGTNPTDAVNLSQLSSFVAGLNPVSPIATPGVIDDLLTAPPLIASANIAYLVNAPATGLWVGLEGHIMEYISGAWVSVLDRPVIAGDRMGIAFEYGTSAGTFTGFENNIVEIVSPIPGSYTYNFTIPTNTMTVGIYGQNSHDLGHLYYYNGTTLLWIDLLGSASGLPTAGNALYYSGNVLNVLDNSTHRFATDVEKGQWNTAYTNRITSLTTTGTSGPATLIANTLNIPSYTGGGGSVSGTTNTVAKFTSSTAVGNSLITDNGTTVTLPSLNVNGTAGAGYLTLIGQSANPTSPTPGTLLLHSKTVNTFTRLEQDNEATTNLVYGRDNVIICKNDTGVTILKGQAVYTSGVVSNTPQISLARANAAGTLPAVGVAVDDILHNTFGQVMTSGILSFNTSVFSADDRVYVSPTTAGALTATRPSGTTNLVQRIGTILVSSATPTIGQMLVAVSPSVLNMETGTIAASFTAASFIATGLSTAGYVTNTAGGVLGTKTIIEAVQFFFDGQGVVINANTTATMEIPYSGTIVGWTLLEVSNTPVPSTIVIDTWKAAYSSYPPVVGGTIWGTKPALTGTNKNIATGLSIAVTTGDIIKCNIDSNTAALKVKLILHIQRA